MLAGFQWKQLTAQQKGIVQAPWVSLFKSSQGDHAQVMI